MKRICSHASTILAVMTVVFLCIHNVNDAMAFYNHPFTKIILILLAALLCVNTASLGLPGRLCALALALAQTALCLFSLWDPAHPLFESLPGLALAWTLTLTNLLLGVLLTVRFTLGPKEK